MKKPARDWSRRYERGLCAALRRSRPQDDVLASALGRQAVGDRRDILGVAKVHERAMGLLGVREDASAALKRAERFFSDVILPIVESHSAARKNGLALIRSDRKLRRRTDDLAAANRSIRDGVDGRKRVEAALEESGERYAKLLRESLTMQDRLRRLLRQLMSKQEDERMDISRKLQDHIAQTLLGLNVRLLALKQGIRLKARGVAGALERTRRAATRAGGSAGRVRNPSAQP